LTGEAAKTVHLDKVSAPVSLLKSLSPERLHLMEKWMK